jgi:parallel beta-helix repeat protein
MTKKNITSTVICLALWFGLAGQAGSDITFSNISIASLKDTSVILQWDSDEAATGQIEYGLHSAYGQLTQVEGLSYWQHVEITGLMAETIYHYRIRARNYQNRETLSPVFTFTTRSSAELTGLIKTARTRGDMPQVYYVKPGGNNSQDGLSPDTAWATPAHAAAQAEAGDLIRVFPGSYGSVDFGHYVGANGIPEAPITMQAYNGTPQITGSVDIRAEHITFDGFKIDNASGGHGIDVRYTNSIKIRNCEVYNSGVDCIYLRDNTYVILENCRVHDSGWNGFGFKPSTSFPASGHHVRLKHCEAYDIMQHNAFDVQDDYATYENCYAHHSLLAPLRIKGEHIVINDFTGQEGNNGIHFTGSFISSLVINSTFPDMSILQSSGIVENVIICGNYTNGRAFGIAVNAGANILIENNEIHTNEEWGFTYRFNDTGSVILRNENVTAITPNEYRVRSEDGANLTVEYTDGRCFSVNGEGEYTTYAFSAGTRTIKVFDTLPPVIADYLPRGTNVLLAAAIKITFSEAMNQETAQNAWYIHPPVSGSFGWQGPEMIFSPDSPLKPVTTYTVTINPMAEDLAGNNLAAEFSWRFITEGKVLVFPNPYIAGQSTRDRITFSNLGSDAVLWIYTTSGELVKEFTPSQAREAGVQEWDISGLASGIYIYYVDSPAGKSKGKLSIIK